MTETKERQTRLAEAYMPDHRREIVPSEKWVRVLFNGEYIADSRHTLLLRAAGHTPRYYFPKDDVRMDLLTPTEHARPSDTLGEATYWTVQVGDERASNAAWSYPDSPELRDYVAFAWKKMDAWFEEDEEIFVHPRDPYTRVDALPSSRHVRVVVAGETVAETDNPTLLFETGLPTRYYIPKPDVRLDLLEPSRLITRCPYKGEARYYHVRVGDERVENVVWYYRYPLPEVGKVANLLCFYNEKVDALYVDGERQEKPETPWSS